MPVRRRSRAAPRARATAAALLACGLLAAASAAAQSALPQSKIYCSEPVTPFCVNRDTVFEDDAAREQCRDEVDTYVEGLEEYVECLGEQQREVMQRAEQLRQRFACMARGESDC